MKMDSTTKCVVNMFETMKINCFIRNLIILVFVLTTLVTIKLANTMFIQIFHYNYIINFISNINDFDKSYADDAFIYRYY